LAAISALVITTAKPVPGAKIAKQIEAAMKANKL
jgi:hypothetical protein